MIQVTTGPIGPDYVGQKRTQENMPPDSQIQHMIPQSNYGHQKTDLASSSLSQLGFWKRKPKEK
jgi:hypothetical protein